MKTRTTVINNSKTAKILESIRLQSDEAKNLLRVANNEIKEENTKLRKEVQTLREEVCRLKADNVDTKNKLFEATETVPLLNKPGVDCSASHPSMPKMTLEVDLKEVPPMEKPVGSFIYEREAERQKAESYDAAMNTIKHRKDRNT